VAVGYSGLGGLHGRTEGTFDGGKKAIADLKTSRATGCNCPAGQPCLNAVGKLVVTYKVKVTITMPPMPSGLSKCKRDRVAAFFSRELRPHEEEHKRRFETYNGTTRRPIEARGCGQDGVKSALDDEAQKMHDDESAAREGRGETALGCHRPILPRGRLRRLQMTGRLPVQTPRTARLRTGSWHWLSNDPRSQALLR